ncbi:MAG: TonB-dependent siderophore receptor, partial [Candidatus Binatia bacterium]
GPASFLFGRSDPGGVINLVTKKPLNTPYHSITQQVGSFNLYRTLWDLTGPVQVPVLPDGAVSYRFSGNYQKGGQWVDFTQTQNVFLAPALTWNIGPATTLTVEAYYSRQDGRSNTGQPAIGMFPANIPVSRSFQEPYQPRDTIRTSQIAYYFRHAFDNDWAITNNFLAARSTLEAADMGNGDTLDAVTLDRSVLYQKLTGTVYSTNLNLTGSFYVLGAKNDILIGTDYYYQFFNYIFSLDGNFPINIYNPIYGTVPFFAFPSAAAKAWQGTADFTSFSSRNEKDLGVYAQDSITLFDKLHVLIGGRYDLADAHSSGGAPSFALASAQFGTRPIDHNQFFSPRLGLVFPPVPWLGFYGSDTKSFGPQNGFATSGVNFPPQIAEGWEGGVKSQLLDGGLSATLAFFDITKSNILTLVPTAADPLARRPLGLVRSQGAELDVLGKLTNELSVIASYSHLDTKVIADNGGLLGKTPSNVAANSGSLFLAYEFAPGSELHGWRAGGGVYAVGQRWGDDLNTFILPAYVRLDAFARYQTVIGPTRVSAQINVQNIANTRFYPGTDIFYNFLSVRSGIFTGIPRAVTASLRVEF